MTDSPPISLVCFDLTSIVIDGSIVERAFAEAIATQGIVAGTQDYARSMVRFDRSHGRAPAAVLSDLFDGDEPRAQAASLAFERSFRAAAQRFGLDVPADVADAMGKTAGSGARICLHTMLSRRSCGEFLGLLRAADLVLCSDDAPRGFPWPDPVLTAMLRLGAADVREVAVVSATPDGVLSGYRAGARILVGVGSGRRAAALFEAGATHVLDSITTLPDLVAEVSSAN
ncbi:MAG TPA: haloacid dehalogenase [Trebonia sp.]|jgi:beta-phosphoglucomutase-like phosphatase (HAD superfamily)|nr:haloacid dehalogenase [Trebonia sp.]